MRSLVGPHSPLPALGMTSLVLGVVALLLAFLPILGIPISALGLLCGGVGFVAALVGRETSLRWSLGGIAACALALGINVAITLAPAGYQGDPHAPSESQPVSDRPLVPPPAPSRWLQQ